MTRESNEAKRIQVSFDSVLYVRKPSMYALAHMWVIIPTQECLNYIDQK